MTPIIAIDLALESSGIASIDENGLVEAHSVKSERKGAQLMEVWDYEISKLMQDLIRESQTPWRHIKVFIERGVQKQGRGNAPADIAELRGAIRWMFYPSPLVEVNPTPIKVFATGLGHATKTDMIEAVQSWGFEVPLHVTPGGKPSKKAQPYNDDIADALALLQFGIAAMGGEPVGGNAAYARKWGLEHGL